MTNPLTLLPTNPHDDLVDIIFDVFIDVPDECVALDGNGKFAVLESERCRDVDGALKVIRHGDFEFVSHVSDELVGDVERGFEFAFELVQADPEELVAYESRVLIGGEICHVPDVIDADQFACVSQCHRLAVCDGDLDVRSLLKGLA